MASTPPISDYASAVDFLLERKTRGVVLGLDRMRRFVAALGDPHLAVPCIHIAGTNGKGSVAAIIEAVLRAAGWRTGLCTSPHLVRLGERVQVDRQSLTPEDITAHVRALAPVVRKIEAEHGPAEGPSYFEVMTALALRHFQQCGCDIAVVEVGLGGRLDATNVVRPEISVITSIGLDHGELLGDTLAAVAREKAGIIKPGRPVVIGRLPDDAEAVVRSVALAHGANVVSVRTEYGDELGGYPRTSLYGDYQRWNAATAALAVRLLPPRWRITEAVMERALLHVAWPGRWQPFSVSGRTVIVDASHNAEGAGVLDQNLARLRAETGRAPIAVTGVLGLARARALVPTLCRHVAEVWFVEPAQSRACGFEQLEGLVPAGYTGRVGRTAVSAVFPEPARCEIGRLGDTIVVTGSIALAGEVLARLDPDSGPPEPHLQDY